MGTVLVAVSVLLVTLSFAWRRLTAGGPVLTLHHLSSNSAVSDEEQGLLADVTSLAAAGDAETTQLAVAGQSQVTRPNRLVSPNNFTGFTQVILDVFEMK